MKKIYCVLILACFLIVASLFTGCELLKSDEYTEYILSPTDCAIALGGLTPEEFVDYESEWYTPSVSPEKRAHIDEDGNLVLYLTDEQKEEMRDAGSLKDQYQNALNNDNIEMSDDYKTIIVNCYAETVFGDIYDAFGASFCLRTYQFVDGIEPKDISIDLILKDGVTGEIKYTIKLPFMEETKMDFSFSEFSPLPTNDF